MNFLSTARARRNFLLLAGALFLVSRALTLTAFPIFNDEAIYIQYAQYIHDNWQQNRFISMGQMYGDWKPPLQYWIGALVIDWGNDPLFTARLVALTASAGGFFGFYLFAKQLWGEPEGLLCALLYVLCPPVIFHNNQYTAETFLFSVAPLFYWTLLKAMEGRSRAFWWMIASLLFATALLLLKQSGFVLVAIGAFLPFVQTRPEQEGETSRPGPAKWKRLGLKFGLALAVIVLSLVAAHAVLPTQFELVRERFNRNWVMSASEVFAVPIQIWAANLRRICDYVGAYYSWTLVPLVGLLFWMATRTRDSAALVLGCMFLTAAAGVAFLLRGFNEYVFNTAVITVLLPLTARAMILAWRWTGSSAARLARFALLACAAFTIAHWIYQDALMSISPGKYLERSTRWAKANYLEQWSTGFGVKEIVAILEKEKRPGIVFADLQWGNPRTALEVYARKRFPNLRMVRLTVEFYDETEVKKVRDVALNLAEARFAIYSEDTSGGRPGWTRNLEKWMCAERQTIRAYPTQMPIVLCRF
jgi:4-amino-4-deoxy-L-arabinose transferase-like glycosyltransferase